MCERVSVQGSPASVCVKEVALTTQHTLPEGFADTLPFGRGSGPIPVFQARDCRAASCPWRPAVGGVGWGGWEGALPLPGRTTSLKLCFLSHSPHLCNRAIIGSIGRVVGKKKPVTLSSAVPGTERCSYVYTSRSASHPPLC